MIGLLSQMSLYEIDHLGKDIGGGRGVRPRTAASVTAGNAVWGCNGSAENVIAGVWASARVPRKDRTPVPGGTDPGEVLSEAAVPTPSTARAGTSGPCGRHSNRLPRAGGGTPTPRRINDPGSPDTPRTSVRWHYGTVLTQQCPNPRRHLVASVRRQSKVPVAAGTARPPVGAGAAGRDTRFSHHAGDTR